MSQRFLVWMDDFGRKAGWDVGTLNRLGSQVIGRG